MSIYWIIVALVIVFGIMLPQDGVYRKYYIWIMAVLHAFVCGFRYMYLTGDLIKYANDYRAMLNYGWFSDEVFQGGRNTAFSWLMKLVSSWTHGDFQAFLIVLAVITQIIVAVLIYKYSPKPWLSYLVYNCMGFYVAGFSLIKQYLAMAVIMWAAMAIFEKKPVKFLVLTLIAGAVHMPALCFLPAYFIANRRINAPTLLVYIMGAVAIYLSRTWIVGFVADFYYEEETFRLASSTLGGRFLVIVIILVAGFLIRGFREKNYERLYNIIIVAAIFQMFSGFDNVFTRLADYYLQFLVLFIPMIFYSSSGQVEINKEAVNPLLAFEKRDFRIMVMLLVVILIWWYHTTCIGVTIEYALDDYTNFRFMWEVVQ